VITARLLCACALSFATFVAGAQDKKPAAAIVGTWTVVTYEDRTEGQPVKYPFGEKPRGLLVYDATGRMSIQLMKMPRLILRPKWTEGGKQWTGLRVFERVK
jgi:hypothetical protein